MEFEEEQSVQYLSPKSPDEALAMLAEHGDEAKIVGGSQSLAVFLRQRLISPSYLISLAAIPELRGINVEPDGGLRIGAMTTQHEIENLDLIRKTYSALSDAAAVVASPLVRRRGTIGGNLVHADPTADPPAALIALGATVELASEKGQARFVPIDEFFVDYMETAVNPDELLVAIHLPPLERSGSAYLK